jgi:hypothetical protein
MSQAFGHSSFFGWAKQVAYATAVTPPTKFVECETISPSDDRKLIHKPLLGHVGRRRVVRDKHSPSLGLKFPFCWEGIEQLLEAALGSVGTAGPVGGVYTHTYALAAALPVGFTGYVDIDDGNISGDHVQQVIGCQIDKLTLSQEMGGTLDVELEIMGREFVDVARTAPSLPTYDALDYGLMTLATINPASVNYELPVRKFKLSIENNLHKDKYLLTGAGKRSGFGRGGQRSISLELEVEYESDTVLAYFKNATATDLRFKWVSGLKSLTITTPTGYFQGSRPAAGDTGPVYMTMNYDSLVSATDNDEMGLVLVNATSSVG